MIFIQPTLIIFVKDGMDGGEHTLYDNANNFVPTSGRMMLRYPLEGNTPDDKGKVAWPGSLRYEGFPLHKGPVYIRYENWPMYQYIWGLKFLKKRLMEPVTITIQYSNTKEDGLYKDNSK